MSVATEASSSVIGSEPELVAETRARRRDGIAAREARAAALTSGTFLLAAGAFALLGGWNRGLSATAALLLVGGFALLSQIEVEIGSGFTVPTQLVFVPMLFALPLPLVPLAVCAGYLLGGVVEVLRGRKHVSRIVSLPGCSWYALAPAAVLLVAGGGGPPSWQRWPLYAAALAAQCVADLVHSSLHEWLAHGVAPRRLLAPLGRAYLIDVLLSPVALVAAVAGAQDGLSTLALVPLAGVFAALAHERKARNDSELKAAQLATLANTDPLTGLANRRAFGLALEHALAARPREVAVCILDLDHFKAYNDRHGHLAGDALLRDAAVAWSAELRSTDVLARLGGEEFGLLLPDCPPEAATAIADRLRAATPAPATCSAGLASWDGSESAVALQERADTALYCAKDLGRARLVAAS